MWDLEALGFGPAEGEAFARYSDEGVVPGRVALAQREQYVVWTETGELRAELAGRLRHDAEAGMRPATGDWVVLRTRSHEGRGTIVAVLPRRTQLSRKVAGPTTREQVIAANIDHVLLVAGLDGDFNLRRIERGLVLAWDSGAVPVVILNKADACADVEARRLEVEAVAPGVGIHVVSALRGDGLESLLPYFDRARTGVLVGSSGAGKSTLTNALVGHVQQATRPVRAHDSRGRHTTTARELIAVPTGGWIVDTPGLRELQLWADEESAAAVFDDITALAQDCRFRDCAHAGEPGCAVRAAVADGRLDAGRLASYEKLARELQHMAARQDAVRRHAENLKRRAQHRAARQLYKKRDGGKRGAP